MAISKTQGEIITGGADSQPCPNRKGPKVAKVYRYTREVFKAPTSGRSFFTIDAACRAEASSIVRSKYPNEPEERDNFGRIEQLGWSFYDDEKLVALRDRLAQMLRRKAISSDDEPMVKALVWENFDAWTFWAHSVVGTYRIEDLGHGVVLRRGEEIIRFIDELGEDWGAWPSVERAKFAAQSDFDLRIISAIQR